MDRERETFSFSKPSFWFFRILAEFDLCISVLAAVLCLLTAMSRGIFMAWCVCPKKPEYFLHPLFWPRLWLPKTVHYTLTISKSSTVVVFLSLNRVQRELVTVEFALNSSVSPFSLCHNGFQPSVRHSLKPQWQRNIFAGIMVLIYSFCSSLLKLGFYSRKTLETSSFKLFLQTSNRFLFKESL